MDSELAMAMTEHCDDGEGKKRGISLDILEERIKRREIHRIECLHQNQDDNCKSNNNNNNNAMDNCVRSDEEAITTFQEIGAQKKRQKIFKKFKFQE